MCFTGLHRSSLGRVFPLSKILSTPCSRKRPHGWSADRVSFSEGFATHSSVHLLNFRSAPRLPDPPGTMPRPRNWRTRPVKEMRRHGVPKPTTPRPTTRPTARPTARPNSQANSHTGQQHQPNSQHNSKHNSQANSPFRKCSLEGKQLTRPLYSGFGNPLASLN